MGAREVRAKGGNGPKGNGRAESSNGCAKGSDGRAKGSNGRVKGSIWRAHGRTKSSTGRAKGSNARAKGSNGRCGHPTDRQQTDRYRQADRKTILLLRSHGTLDLEMKETGLRCPEPLFSCV